MEQYMKYLLACRGWLAAFLFLLAAGFPAHATNHITKIDEVMAGAFGRPDVQFVEIKFECGQNVWAGVAKLAFFDAGNHPVGEFVFPSNPPDSCAAGGSSALIATQAFADLELTPEPDFLMPPLLVPGSGKVCFQGIPEQGGVAVNLCLTYGDFTGDTQQASPANAPALPPTGICALQRGFTGFFGEPNSNDDFLLNPPDPRNSAGATGAVTVAPRFLDVPADHPFFRFAEALWNGGVSGGCGGGNFCPDSGVTRAQMAVFLLRARQDLGFAPPACSSPAFADVPCTSPFAPWVNELAARGISGGCGNGNFCPDSIVTREQMAVLLLRASEAPGYVPPACTSQLFADVPCSSPFAPWINELATRGITRGCGDRSFCPGAPVTRGQMAVFLSSTFHLPVPFQGCPALPPFADDHGDTPKAATVLAVDGALLDGAIQVGRDVDFFAFDAVAGERIVIETSGLGPGSDTLLRLLGPDGTTLIASDDNGAGGLASRVLFTAAENGSHFVAVGHRSASGVGTYRVGARRIQDDHGNSASQATRLVAGGAAVAGTNEIAGDVDFFSFSALDGQTLDIRTGNLGAGSDTILHLFGPDGVTQLSTDDDGGGGLSSRILYTFQADGIYFVSVRQFPGGTGTYRVSVATP
ncbi:MAG TPA: S-layer homology domain-containing protein [Thermoanaerobaculia bacterium]|nr:S-layer homology domain-containing protein [Thermoanaerobaculia bacterium]